ncbi:putative fluoride ion transporter CrcB [Actinoplanes sp. NBRC 14428]|nr:putative fluoride ion transporter CrcB [Actinoplanes sp. NBRC 14428]
MDPDVDLRVVADRTELRPSPWPVLGMISAGGMLGALARYGIGAAWPHAPAGFAWATWTVNVTGCFLIGVLMVLIHRFRPEQRLLRPFWGVGVLGGYTTFSTATVDVLRAAPATALGYLAATLAGALIAVWLGTALTEAVVRR